MQTSTGDIRFTVTRADDGRRLDMVIASHISQCSRTLAATLIKDGFIRLDNQVVKPAHQVRSGDDIHGRFPPPDPGDIVPEAIPLDILYRDHSIVVVNKPAGLVVHPAAGHKTGTLVHGLLYHFPGVFAVGGQMRPGIVHRLDKDTSGCLVVALNDAAHQEISSQFKARTVYKEYLALVKGHKIEQTGEVNRPIGRHPVDRKKMTVDGRGARPARTLWRVVHRYPSAALVTLNLKTGRTHQIRVHLKSLGHPVVGDPIYGPRRKADTLEVSPGRRIRVPRQMLHARRLGFVHPSTGKKVQFEASIPTDMADIISALDAGENRSDSETIHLQPDPKEEQ